MPGMPQAKPVGKPGQSRSYLAHASSTSLRLATPSLSATRCTYVNTLPVPPLLRRMRRHTSAPVIFFPTPYPTPAHPAWYAGYGSARSPLRANPCPRMTWKSLDTAEIIAHIASRANGSLSNTGDTDRPRRSPGHVIMSHAAHRGHGRSRTKPAIMRLLDTMLRLRARTD